MKKIVTILMLVGAILVGGMTINAKTTKKKGKPRTTQSSKSEVEGASKLNYGTFFSDRGAIEFRNLREIEAALYNAGFKLKSSSPYKFTSNGTTVEINCEGDYVYGIDINFKNEKTLESFVYDKMQSSGFIFVTHTASGMEYFENDDMEMCVQFKQVSLNRK